MIERRCHKCGCKLGSWDEMLTEAFKTYDICEQCFCDIYNMDKDALRVRMTRYFGMRPCMGKKAFKREGEE